MLLNLDGSAIEEEAQALVPRFGALAYRSLLSMSIVALILAFLSAVHAYRILQSQAIVEAVAPGGAVYRPAVYVAGQRPGIPIAITEEMLILRNEGR